MKIQTKPPETASYGRLTEITGRPYRTLKKILSEAGVEPVEVRVNAVLFDRLKAIEAIEMPGENVEDLNITPLVFRERIRAVSRASAEAATTRVQRQEVAELLWALGTGISVNIGCIIPALVQADPRLRLTDQQLESGHDPFASLREMVGRCVDKIESAKLVRIAKPPTDPAEYCKKIIDKFASIVIPALDRLVIDVEQLDMAVDKRLINQRITRARKRVEEFQ